jgi:parallel beta-helix repeat protein
LNGSIGIYLIVCNNNTLSDNTCNSNNSIGIEFRNSNYNSLTGNIVSNSRNYGISINDASNDNTLVGNTVSNSSRGIALNNSNANIIYNNNFIGNLFQAIVDGSSSGNIFNFDKPTGGNFWSNWTTPDADHDCFVDIPYTFTGGQDNYPWVLQDGWLISTDSDGVTDAIENSAPNNGDGNNDGTPDSQQNNVTSLLNAVDQEYVTIVSEVGTLENVSATADPPAAAPDGVEFPVGFFEFTVSGLTPGGSTTVTLLLPAGHTVGTYYKYGPGPGNETHHWYEFLWDGTPTGTGAEILPDRIILHFVDGQRGDNDLTVNGQIHDPGAPAAIQVVGIDIKPGSYPNSFNNDGHGVIPVAILGSDSFNVSQIDVSTLRLAGLALSMKGNGAYQFSIKDVSGNFSNTMNGEPDGYPDLVCQFVDQDGVWKQGESIATVRGKLSGGAPFMGTDSIKITQ